MNETTPEFVREKTSECINEETGEYEKHKYTEDGRYKIYLRFISSWFIPCEECQKTLHNLIYNAPNLYLGNKSYDPPIELSRSWDLDDNSWIELEKREATKNDFRRIYGLNWEKYWKDHQEGYNK